MYKELLLFRRRVVCILCKECIELAAANGAMITSYGWWLCTGVSRGRRRVKPLRSAGAYSGIPRRESVNDGVGEYVKGEVSINGMESFWSMLKRGYVGVFHRMSPEHLARYVAEFEGRHNRRDLNTGDQMAAIVRGTEGKQLRYRDLTAHRHGRQAVAV